VDATESDWEKIKTLFEAALEQPAAERTAFLAKSCADEAVRLQVEKLLLDHEAAGSFLEDSMLDQQAALSIELLSQADLDQPNFGLNAELASLQRLQMDSLIGQRVGAYQIDRLIGYGGMASVYAASRADAAFQKQVAVKIVRSGSESDEILNRFRNERQTLAGLDHPNIVRLLDGGSTENGLPYLVMEFVEGSAIDGYCDAQALSIEGRLRLFCKVCDAVEYAHQHLVIHRDLKPANILVTADGMPMLLDFGIAKVLDLKPLTPAMCATETNTRRMTLAYASPEQVRGESVTTATDIYSLGVVLFELLTGHRPYKLRQPTPAEIERAICEEEPEKLSTAIDRVEVTTNADGTTGTTITPELVSRTREGEPEKLRRRLTGDLDNIALMALQKERGRRYASAGELARDLQRHLDHQPVKARRSTLGYRVLKFIARHRSEVAAVLLMTVVMLSGISYTSWKAYQAEENARAQLNLPSKGRRSIAVLGFKNVSGNPDTAWLSTALSEMLTTELMAGQRLRTISGEDIARMKINLSLAEPESLSRASLQRVYKNLGSDYVVVGSYLHVGGSERHVRLDLRLEDAAHGETIAAIAESGTVTALPELVTRAGADLRDKLRIPRISPSESAGIQALLPSNQKATRLYAEGLARLRYFDAMEARVLLEKAIALDPNFALAHSALAMSWSALGHDKEAKQEAEHAFNLSENLPREDRLLVEARYRTTRREWNRAVQIYATLFEFFPDSLEYGLGLVETKVKAGQARDAVATIDALHSLPSPLGDDPRIDLEEAKLSGSFSDNARGRAALGRARERATARGEKMLVAQVRMGQGVALRASGKLSEAIRELENAKDLFVASGDRNSAAQALHEIAIAQALQGNFAVAQKKFEEALATYRISGNEQGQAAELNALGNVLDNQGDMDSSKKSYGESLTIYRQLEDKLGAANVLNNWANVVDQEGDLSAARRMFEEALGIYRAVEDRHGVAMGSTNLAMVQYEQGDLLAAKKLTIETLKLGHEIDDKHGVPYLLATLGEIQKEQGKFVEARKNEEEAESMRREMGEDELEAESLVDLALLALEEKRFREAATGAQKAAEALHKSNALDMEAYAYAVQAQGFLAQKKVEEAHEAVRRSVALSNKAVIFNIRLPLTILLARLRLALNGYSELDTATRTLQGVLAEAARHGFLGYQLDAGLALGEIELKASASHSQGSARLATVEREARAKGFTLIASKAAAMRTHA